MKKRIISVFLLLAILICFTGCDILQILGYSEGNENSGNENENAQDGDLPGFLNEPRCKHTELEFEKTVFEAGEEIKAEIFMGDFSIYNKYYDIYAINEAGSNEYLIRHGDCFISESSYQSNNDESSATETKNSEYITIPEEFFNKEKGVLFVCVSIPTLFPRVNPLSDGAQTGYDCDVFESKCYHYVSYERKDGKVNIISTFHDLYYQYIPENDNTDLYVKHAIINQVSADSAYFKINESGYDINKIELDLYFGRHFYGTAEQYRASVANIGKASIYLENDNGKQILLGETSENYISEKYKTIWERVKFSSFAHYVSYNENSTEKITIPAEFIEGERGILFLSLYGRDMNINGSEEEKISEIPLQYTVKDGKVYLSRKFLMHRDENSNLDFFLDEIVTEEEALKFNKVPKYPGYVDYNFIDCEGGKRVTEIIISDENISIYGLNVNSTAEEFRTVFEKLGYTTEELKEFYDITDENGWCMMAYRNGVKIYLSHCYLGILTSDSVLNHDMCFIYICSGGNYDFVDEPMYSSPS